MAIPVIQLPNVIKGVLRYGGHPPLAVLLNDGWTCYGYVKWGTGDKRMNLSQVEDSCIDTFGVKTETECPY